MSIIDRFFAGAINKAVEQRLKQAIGDKLYASVLQSVGFGNVAYNEDDLGDYVTDGYLFNPTVYAIVSFLAQKASTIPWFVYDVKDQKALKLYKSGTPDRTIKKEMLFRKALEPIEDHELMTLFSNPNPLQGFAEFIEQAVGFKFVTGNTYIHAIGPSGGVNAGKLQELWVLPSQAIEIITGDKTRPVKWYQYINNKDIKIPPEEIIHLKYWTPEYLQGAYLYGLSPIRASRRVISKNNASFDAANSAFNNMGAIGFISGNKDSNGMGLTTEQAQAIEEVIARKTGPKNRGKIMVTSADLRWQQIGMSPADLAIIESDKMDLRTLCNVYHVPSELFNDAANKTYSNTQEASRAIWVNAVIPALTQFRDAFNHFIAGKYEGNIYIDYDTSVVPELQDDLAQQVASLQNAWWITPNEKREIMQWEEDPRPEMNDIWIPAGLMPISGYTEPVEDEMPTEEEVDEELEKMGINDYGTKRG